MQILGLPLRNVGEWDPEVYVSTGRLGDSVVCSSGTSTASEVDPVDSSALPQILVMPLTGGVSSGKSAHLLCTSMTPPVM